MIPDETLRKGYWYVLTHTTGYVEELYDIHPDLPAYLVKEGVINI